MPRFELRKGATRIDCDVSVIRNRLTIRTNTFGKRVTYKTTSQNFTRSKLALAELDVVAAKLLAKGYVRLGSDGKPARVAKPAKGSDVLGPLADHTDKLELQWQGGAVSRARLAAYCESDGPNGEALFGMVLACPAFHSMRAFALGTIDERGPSNYSFFVRKLAAAKSRPPLEELFLGDFHDDWAETAWLTLGNLGKLWALLPSLEKLTLRGGTKLVLGTIRHAALKELVIRTSQITKANIQKVASATCPALETLAVSCKNTDDLIAPLSRAKVVKQLATLDLSNGGLSDAGAAALLVHRAAFQHLKKLDLRKNALTPVAKRTFAGWKAAAL